MPSIEYAVEIAAAPRSNQDRASVLRFADSIVVVLADGAGGSGHGARTAQTIIDAVAAVGAAHHDWCDLLRSLDRNAQRSGPGQSTAVIVSISDGLLTGASVGDSGAWLVCGTEALDLTANQLRKPLLGGGCLPRPLLPTPLDDHTLLVASDGLFRYASHRDLVSIATHPDLSAAAAALIDLVRLPTGALQDDIAVVVCRQRAYAP